jgi:hypothetical protein
MKITPNQKIIKGSDMIQIKGLTVSLSLATILLTASGLKSAQADVITYGTGTNGNIYSINITNNVITDLGNAGFTSATGGVNGMAFDTATSRLYFTNSRSEFYYYTVSGSGTGDLFGSGGQFTMSNTGNPYLVTNSLLNMLATGTNSSAQGAIFNGGFYYLGSPTGVGSNTLIQYDLALGTYATTTIGSSNLVSGDLAINDMGQLYIAATDTTISSQTFSSGTISYSKGCR